MVPLALLLGGLFGLGGLGSTALAVVLPEAANALGISVAQSSWWISLYVLTMAVSTPVYGRLVDKVGVQLPLLGGVLLMAAGALAAALAQSFEVMVAARLVQGLGTGVGPTLSVAVLGTRYEGAERIRGLAIAAGVAAAIGALGPMLGGLVEVVATWRGTAAMPTVALVLLVFLWRRVEGQGHGSSFDLMGAAWVALAAAGVIMLLQSPSSGWTVAGVGFALALVGVPSAVRRSRRGPEVFLPAAVLLNPRIVRTCLVAGTVPAGWFALLVVVPTRLGEQGWSPVVVGTAMLPSAAVAMVAPRFTPWVAARLGAQGALTASATLSCSALLLAALGLHFGSVATMVASVALVSVAFSLGQPSLFAKVGDLAAVPVRGVALGFATLVFLTCGSAGSAVIGGLSGVVGIQGGVLALAGLCGLGVGVAVVDQVSERRRVTAS